MRVLSDEEMKSQSSLTKLGPARSRRGRPSLMSPSALLERIRQLAGDEGLYRIHRRHGSLYARARRQFGSWSSAVQAAGVDYAQAVERARRRSIETRRRARRQVARLAG